MVIVDKGKSLLSLIPFQLERNTERGVNPQASLCWLDLQIFANQPIKDKV